MLKTRLLWISTKFVELDFIKSCRVNKSSYERQLRVYEFSQKCSHLHKPVYRLFDINYTLQQ